jgi:hypothetical protein
MHQTECGSTDIAVVKLTFFSPYFWNLDGALERTYGSDKCRITDEQNEAEKEQHYW